MDKERLNNAGLGVILELAAVEVDLAGRKHGRAGADFVHEVVQEKISRLGVHFVKADNHFS